MSWCCWYFYYWKRCFLRRVAATLLQQKNLVPMSYISFWEWQKVVPQGPFGRIKLYFEPNGRPARTFWADKIVILTRKSSRRGLLGGSNCILSLKGYNSLKIASKSTSLVQAPPPVICQGSVALASDSICLPKKPLRDAFPLPNTTLSAQKAPAERLSGSKYNLICPKGPCGTTFCYSQSEIYDIGTEIRIFHCFVTKIIFW